MKILISSYAPFTKSGYSTQINKIMNCLYNYDDTIEFGFICWDVRRCPQLLDGQPGADGCYESGYNFDSVKHIFNSNEVNQKKKDIEIYKKSRFFISEGRDNFWKKIHLFNNNFKCDKLLVFQDIWVFEKYDISKIDCKKYCKDIVNILHQIL